MCHFSIVTIVMKFILPCLYVSYIYLWSRFSYEISCRITDLWCFHTRACQWQNNYKIIVEPFHFNDTFRTWLTTAIQKQSDDKTKERLAVFNFLAFVVHLQIMYVFWPSHRDSYTLFCIVDVSLVWRRHECNWLSTALE